MSIALAHGEASPGRTPGNTIYGTRVLLNPGSPVFHGRVASEKPKCERHRKVRVVRFSSRRVRNRFPWVNGLRFFNRFYLGHRRPRWITAFDGHGHVLAHTHTHRGLFGCCGVKPPP
ncbi:MAG: hypothetical protein ACRDMH_01250 [Solirubrobacterales bacterium]